MRTIVMLLMVVACGPVNESDDCGYWCGKGADYAEDCREFCRGAGLEVASISYGEPECVCTEAR